MSSEEIDLVPFIIKRVWDKYSIPRREHLIHIPKEIDAEVESGMTCRMLTEAIDRYIINHPEEAIKHRIVVWFGELLCYTKSGKVRDPVKDKIYVSCHGRAYYYDNGKLTEMPHELVHHGSNTYWRYPLPWKPEPLQDMSEKKRDMYSLSPHRTVCYFPGNPMPKMWSKLFDTLRNGIPKGMNKSGGDYYVRDGYNKVRKDKLELVTTSDGRILPNYPDEYGQIKHNHVADHVFNDTAQEPGVHMWFDCRLVYPDINRLNNHSSTNNDRDCLSWPMPQPAGFAQQIQYDPWQYVEYTQYATHDPYRFDRVGDRAIRYYQQMIQQYYDAINNGCSPVDIDGYDWCEAMK